MANDDLKTEYHLTSEGWITGTTRFFNDPQGEIIQRPENAVETWLHRIYQSSGWSRDEITWKRIWTNPNIPTEQLDNIRQRFPSPVDDSREV